MVESIKELREICYKGSKGRRPLYMEWVTMKISIYVTKLLLYTPIRADQVTISMILLAIIGSVFMAFGNLLYMLIGILRETEYKSSVVLGFLCAIFSRSTVLTALKSAVVKNAIRDKNNKKVGEKLKKYASITGKS